MATPLGQLEGKYEILEKLREGGMGAVYRVRHRLLDEVRVVKLIRPQLAGDENLRTRFLREARTAIRVKHPNIAQLYDFAMDDDGNAFIVMEFISGVTLEELLRKNGPPPLGLCLEVAQQGLAALGYLHRKGVVHRDVSPDNLMLSQDEDGLPLVKLIDLGVAKVLEGGSNLTETGMFIGKVRFASPEQFRGEEGVKLDPRSDLYSFGVVLYLLLTGRHPIRGDSLSAIVAGHLVQPPLPFAESDPQGRIPDDVRAIVLRMLEKEPAQRFATAEELHRALGAVKKRFAVSKDDTSQAIDLRAVQARLAERERPGSTQARLDRQFLLGATPAPTPTGPRLGLVEPTQALDRSRADAAAARDRAIAEETAAVEALLAAGRHAEARQALSAAEGRLGPAPELQHLLRRTEEDEGRQHERRSSDLLRKAREASDGARWNEAIALLEEAIALAPGDEMLQAVLRRTREEATKAAEEARRDAAATARRQVVEACQHEVERLLADGELDAAEAALDAASSSSAGAQLEGLRAGLARAREIRDLSEAVETLAARAVDLIAADRLDAAEEAFLEARALAGDEPACAGRVADVERRLRDRRAELARARELAAARADIDTLLADSQLDEADRALQVARRLFPGDELADLEARLASARDQIRAEKLERRLEMARTALSRYEFERAATILQEVTALDPHHPEAARLLADTRRGQAEAAVVEAAARGDLAGAARALELALRMLPGDPRLELLRERLDGLRKG